MFTLLGRRILVVEDEALIAMMLEDCLRDAGATVLGPVANRQDALAELRHQRPDVVLLDLQLGTESALPLALHLQASGIPFIICTGFGNPGLPPGLTPLLVLTKPLEMEALLAALA